MRPYVLPSRTCWKLTLSFWPPNRISKPSKAAYFPIFAFLINALRWSDPDLSANVAADEATMLQRQLAAAEDEEMLKKLDPAENEVVQLSAAEHRAFVEAVKPVTDKYRKELGEEWFGSLVG